MAELHAGSIFWAGDKSVLFVDAATTNWLFATARAKSSAVALYSRFQPVVSNKE